MRQSIYGIDGLRLIITHPQKQWDTKPLTTFSHTTKNHFIPHTHHPPANQKPPPTFTLLIKLKNIIFIVLYCKPVLPCKERPSQLSEVSNCHLAKKLVVDVARNLLALPALVIALFTPWTQVFIQFLPKPCKFTFYTATPHKRTQIQYKFSLCFAT